jgi:hypothetical protein
LAEKDSYSPEYLGTIIAFVLPGFLSLWFIAHFNPESPAASWLSTAENKDTTVGAFLFAGLASLGLGLILSGLRWILFEAIPLLKALRVPERLTVDHRARKENEAAYREITENHYKFYLFYSNTATALLLLMILFFNRLDIGVLIGLAVLEIVLIASARDSIIRLRTKERILLGVYDPKQKTA